MSRSNFVLPAALLLLAGFTAGCSVVNFSGNYYNLPPNAYSEIHKMWKKLLADLPRKYSYKYVILTDKEFKKSKGVPAIAGDTVILPDSFLRYIYQNYYDKRMVILTAVITHEICHKEYDLPSKPPDKHFECDQCAITMLGNKKDTATHYYQSLCVMKNYWFARKGLAGHAANAGWNTANAALLVVTGHARFADFYATDLDERMKLIARANKIYAKGCFPRSAGP